VASAVPSLENFFLEIDATAIGVGRCIIHARQTAREDGKAFTSVGFVALARS
jgi:hypothetical protein